MMQIAPDRIRDADQQHRRQFNRHEYHLDPVRHRQPDGPGQHQSYAERKPESEVVPNLLHGLFKEIFEGSAALALRTSKPSPLTANAAPMDQREDQDHRNGG